MTKLEAQVRLHRFRDSVAFSTESMDQTIYLSYALARKFSVELLRYVKDIDARKFTESKLGTITLGGLDGKNTMD